MQQELTNKELLRFLKHKHIHAKFIDRVKLHYRPLICPYISLINKVRALPGAKVGDIGCGSGQFFSLISEFASPSSLFGIEINDKLIENARELLSDVDKSKIRLEVYDGLNFPANLREMDIIFLIDVLHHVPPANQAKFLHNIAATMKKGAQLVIKDINAANPLVICNKMHDLVVSGEIGHELTVSAVGQLLTEGNLEITSIEKITTYVYPHFTIVAKKP